MRLPGLLQMVALACSVSAFAQGPSGGAAGRPDPFGGTLSTGTVRGGVVTPEGQPVSQAVRIVLQGSVGAQAIFYTDNQGQFEIRGLAPGDYALEAEGDKERFEAGTVQVRISKRQIVMVTISLRARRNTSPAKNTGSVISVGEIDKDVPSKAQQEFQKATKASRDGKAAESLDHLRKAIAIYPRYLQAQNDLGAQLLEQGRLDESEIELRKAAAIHPKAFNPNLNLGILLYRKHELAEALETLNRALSIESDSASARFNRGLVFLALHDDQGAEKDFKAAHQLGGAEFSLALFELGRIYMDRADRKLALDAFEAYLREAPNSAYAAEARKMAGMLR